MSKEALLDRVRITKQTGRDKSAMRAQPRPVKPGVRRAKKLLATTALVWTMACWLMLALAESRPSLPNSQLAVTPPIAQAAQNSSERSEQK